jgi:hypothetical protein
MGYASQLDIRKAHMPSQSYSSLRNNAILEEFKKSPRDVPLVRRVIEQEVGHSPLSVPRERPIPTSELFGCNVYSMAVMERTLPKPIFAKLCEKMAGGQQVLDKATSDAVAHAVRVWAMERGATHFTHWFQPQNNRTAEKHDSFLSLRYDFENHNLKVKAWANCIFPNFSCVYRLLLWTPFPEAS